MLAGLSLSKKGYLGSRIARKEDPRFLTGQGKYLDDIHFPDLLYAKIIRSTHAHAKINEIDFEDVLRNFNDIQVFDNKTIAASTNLFRSPLVFAKPLSYPILPVDKVRHVGEPLAAVVAKDPYIAEDAAELVRVKYEPLSPVCNVQDALKPDATRVYDDWGDNIAYRLTFHAGNLPEAFSKADHVVTEDISSHRCISTPMEPKGVIARYEPWSGSLSIWASTQWPFLLRAIVSEILRIPENKVHVFCPDVGGAFGGKNQVFREEVLIAFLSKLTSQPVKWVETRQEELSAGAHAREQTHHISVAFKSDGRMLGITDRIIADLGTGTMFPSWLPPLVTASLVPGPYDVQNYEYELLGVVTNKSAYAAYRGFGMSLAAFVIERILDIASKDLRISRIEIRNRNLVRSAQFPYTSATGAVYDSGSYHETLAKAVEVIDYSKQLELQRSLRLQGRFLGIGLGCYVEGTAPNLFPTTGMGGAYDSCCLVMTPDGKVTLETGLSSQGQGLETALAQAVADELGLTPDDVNVSFANTDSSIFGLGAWGGRGAVIAGGSALRAARRLRDRIINVAAQLLEARKEDVELNEGEVFVKGVPRRRLSLAQIARAVYFERFKLPANAEFSLREIDNYDPGNTSFFPSERGTMNVCATYSNGAHAAVVEVDVETGSVKVLKYIAVEDCGTMLNPNIVEGQVHGGIAQGIGGAIYEELLYNSNGQLITNGFLDYLVPTSMEVPDITVQHVVTPSPFTVNGIKGAGEGGAIPSSAVLAAAVEDALSHLDVKITSTPLKPEKIRNIILRVHPQVVAGKSDLR